MNRSEMTLSQLDAAHAAALRAGDLPAADDLVAELRWRHEWARGCGPAIRRWERAKNAASRARVARNTAIVRAAVAAARGRAA